MSSIVENLKEIAGSLPDGVKISSRIENKARGGDRGGIQGRTTRVRGEPGAGAGREIRGAS